VFLIAIIFSEFGAAVWALISRANFEDEMAKAMEVSLSSYTTDKAVAENWKSLQQQVIVPALYHKPSVYYKLSTIFHIIIIKTTTTINIITIMD
jgi:endonuclease III